MSPFTDLQTDAVAIGRFDGLHLGHKALISNIGTNGALVVIDTFKANLTPVNFLNRFCKNKVIIYALSDIHKLSAEEFLAKLKEDLPNLQKIVVGDDFRFGNERSAGAEELKKLFDKETVVVGEVRLDGVGVHSRFIRSLIVQGDVKKAAKFLGRNYEVKGNVVSGQGIGKQQFVPTVNLSVENFLLPNEGVYATRTQIDGKKHDSVTFVGHRLSTDGNFAVETHLLDFEPSDTQEVWIEFVQKIRDNEFYEKTQELKARIELDIAATKDLLGFR